MIIAISRASSDGFSGSKTGAGEESAETVAGKFAAESSGGFGTH